MSLEQISSAGFSRGLQGEKLAKRGIETTAVLQNNTTKIQSPVLSVLALGPTVIPIVYSCLDLGPETGGLQHV